MRQLRPHQAERFKISANTSVRWVTTTLPRSRNNKTYPCYLLLIMAKATIRHRTHFTPYPKEQWCILRTMSLRQRRIRDLIKPSQVYSRVEFLRTQSKSVTCFQKSINKLHPILSEEVTSRTRVFKSCKPSNNSKLLERALISNNRMGRCPRFRLVSALMSWQGGLSSKQTSLVWQDNTKMVIRLVQLPFLTTMQTKATALNVIDRLHRVRVSLSTSLSELSASIRTWSSRAAIRVKTFLPIKLNNCLNSHEGR